MSIANYITIFRILMIPVFLLLVTADPPQLTWSFIVFFFATISDAVDGIVARRTHTVTSLGKFVDPMADKLFIVSAFIALTALGRIPLWLALLVISRDVILSIGWVGLYIVTGVKKIAPSIISKITTFFQMVTLGAALIALEYREVLFILAGFFTVISGVHYIIRTAVETHNTKIVDD